MTEFETLAENVDTDLEHEYVVANDVRLHVVTAGPEDGDLVVLLHGFPDFWYSWRHQIPALADAGYRVLAPDMRGYNQSEKPPGVESYRIDELVADVVGLVDAYTDEPIPEGDDAPPAERPSAHVAGHDWGGGVAWMTAITEPEVVDRLAVINSPHPERFREVMRTPAQLKRSWYFLPLQLPTLPEYNLTRNDAAFLETAYAGVMPEHELRHYRDAIKRPGAATATLNYYRAMFREGLRQELPLLLPAVTMPDPTVVSTTLLIWGMNEPALDPANLHGLDRWVPDLRIERLHNVGHWPQLEAPERVIDELLDHLHREPTTPEQQT